MDMLLDMGIPVMLVGLAGTGKTVLMNDKLISMGENWAIANVPFNFYTTSEMLQRVLEKPLEKKAGRNYGPPGSKRLVYFVDDLNMPEVCLGLSLFSSGSNHACDSHYGNKCNYFNQLCDVAQY